MTRRDVSETMTPLHNVKGHWFLPSGGQQTCPVAVTSLPGDGHGFCTVGPSRSAGLGQGPHPFAEVVRFQNFHDLLGRLHWFPPRGLQRFATSSRPEEGT
jgi:hypothetical protein